MPRRPNRPLPPGVPPHRAFDPRRIGALETEAWVRYYRHEWLRFLRAAIGLTRHTFGLPWPQTFYGAWLILRANQLWAPNPDNDPVAAGRCMTRFYALVGRRYSERIDPARASELEVEWWRVHRNHQHEEGLTEESLVDALAALYAYAYSVPEAEVRVAARERALAMRYSDQWVREGRDLSHPLVVQVHAALVRSYAGLLSAVHRPALRAGELGQLA
jgi:hypothetical protein